jgi:prepilin-type N-terminal cleavage/methylation domain-containing protein
LDSEDLEIDTRCHHISVGTGGVKAFTLVELLVVISVISVLLAISLPALNGARHQAHALLGMHNQREVTNSINLYATDNDDLYPPSVATVGFGDSWNWSDLTRLIGYEKRSPQIHRSMSAYLRNYITDAGTMFCPNAPQKFQYLQEAWDAGDDWDNPDTSIPSDPLSGTYCFYWGYTGYLGEGPRLFRGPRTPASLGGQSQLLTSDYFGYGHWRTPRAFASCERLSGADIDPETQLTSAWWKADGDPNTAMPNVKLRAGYTDGHVETYSPSDAIPMRISMTPEGVPPFPDGGPSAGLFYIPRNAAR